MKFFASYFFHFLGYAIAFHILLKGGHHSFECFGDSFIKVIHTTFTEQCHPEKDRLINSQRLQVITMLMGEYNYYQNFLHSGAVAKVLFVLFLLDMSVVLMNLVLGLAVSDIEQLQKNSGKFLNKIKRI